MRKFSILAAVLVSLLAGGARVAQAASDLQVYFIDVDGGQSTLFVTPAGKSLLIDTGWAGNNGLDAGRIVAVAVSVGSVSRIEAVLTPLVNMAKSGTPSPLKSAATI